MSNYSEGKIYKLYVKGIEDVYYIGSTTISLNSRLSHHKHQAKEPTQKKCNSCVLFEDNNEVCIELLEEYSCTSKQELEERERVWIEKYPDCINKNIPTRGWKERWIANRDHNLQKHREWIANNKEQQAAYKKEKREANLEEARQKERESNARRDKAKRNEWKNKKVQCSECKLILSRNNFPTHKKKKHKDIQVEYILVEEEPKQDSPL